MLAALHKVYAILSPSGRRNLLVLVFLMVLAAGIEVLGLLSIYPFAAAAIDPGVIHTTPQLSWLYKQLNFSSNESFLTFLAVGASLAFLAGNLADSLTHWLIYRFAFRERHRLSIALLSRYLGRPFVWLRLQHSAELMNNVLDAVHDTAVNVLVRMAVTLARGLVSLFIVLGLLWLQPVAAVMSALVLGVLYKLVNAVTRASTERRGLGRDEHRRQRNRALMGALVAVKEARALPRRHHFLAQFAHHSLRVNDLEADLELMAEFPFVAIQTGAFASILGLSTLLLGAGYGPAQVFPLVGVYALATLRLVPALEHIYALAVRIRFHMPSLELVHRELAAGPAPPGPCLTRLPLREAIRLEGLSFTYPGASAPAVANVTLEIARGATLALVGTSGSGKTTLADLICGLLEPGEGRLCIDGQPLALAEAWQNNLGYVPQEVCLLDDTLRRNIALGIPDEQIDPAAVERAARAASLDFELPQGYETPLGERGVSLSGGQRQRVGIARALYHDPDVLIFDEATSALDNATEAGVIESLRQLSAQGKTVIVIAHRLSTVRDCARLVVVEQGRVVAQGSYTELLAGCPAFARLAHLQ